MPDLRIQRQIEQMNAQRQKQIDGTMQNADLLNQAKQNYRTALCQITREV